MRLSPDALAGKLGGNLLVGHAFCRPFSNPPLGERQTPVTTGRRRHAVQLGTGTLCPQWCTKTLERR